MILTDYLIGFIEDNAGFFALPRLIGNGLVGCTDYFGYPTGVCQNLFTNNQPLVFVFSFLLASLVNPVAAYNAILLASSALNLFFGYRFYTKLFGRFIGILLAGIFVASPFLAYQSRSHLDLLQFWPVIWFLHTMLFSTSRSKAVVLGLLLTLITSISNYLGYFTLLFTALYLLARWLMCQTKLACVTRHFRNVVTTALVFSLTTLIFMAPYIQANYLSPNPGVEAFGETKAVNRTLDDFIIFSSRPWYYLVPSVDNPFFGSLANTALTSLAKGGNYLTQNYFKAEHSASFVGWVNLILALLGCVALVRRNTPHQARSAISYPALALTIGALVVLAMPPVVTINATPIYTPSYGLFKLFPMFRVLARSGILSLFLILIFTGYGYVTLVRHRLPRLLLGLLALISIAEFIIPLKISHVGTPPKVYTYLGAANSLKSPVVVYPYTKTTEAIFWMTTHNQPLINPRMYDYPKTGFVSEDFTNLLSTAGGLEQASSMNAKYLVYFYETDGGASTAFFDSSTLLTYMGDFRESSQGERQLGGVLRIVEAGSAVSNSARLYKFR
jgi:hypothetical protein